MLPTVAVVHLDSTVRYISTAAARATAAAATEVHLCSNSAPKKKGALVLGLQLLQACGWLPATLQPTTV